MDTRKHNQPTMNSKLIATAALLVLTLATACADPASEWNASDRGHRRDTGAARHESHNYIIERQQAGQVSGVPISRRIIGSREIDIYRDGSMFEKNNLVGVKR